MSSHEYLLHMRDEIRFIRSRLPGLTLQEFQKDEVMKRAFVRSLEIIGEAARKLPADFRAKHSAVEWRLIAGTRDKLIHDYFGVDYALVWDIAVNELPLLEEQIATILSGESRS